jgi:hypothetical protein
MANQKDAAKGGKNRKRRNALERRSLPKDLKRQFMGTDKTLFKILLDAWKDSRKKVSLGANAA